MMRIVSLFLDIVLPPHEDVRRARRFSPEKAAALFAPREGARPWIIALFPYRDREVRALIRAVKYHGEARALAPAALLIAEYLVETIAERALLDGWAKPLLVPIPASAKRLRERGYNQAARIAEAAIPFIQGAAALAPRALARGERESQVSVPRERRAANIAGAFSVPDPTLIRDRHIILVDDVTESGATFMDARRALLEADAADVIAIALAH